ncbi:hypothetical protein FHS92_001752 [Sphingobium subterraneum]|uniref:Uncharacterized protein n=1 Tax=Sphingobium subterraneum TaxID=627688 RepID=A0A841IZD8_9SPHN|nr:hypothetical protein [Sphingobium subterraneum]
MTLLDLRNLANSGVELIERAFPRVGQLDLGESDVVEPDFAGIYDRTKADNDPAFDEAANALLARRFRQSDFLGKVRKGDPSILPQNMEYFSIKIVQIGCCFHHIHMIGLHFLNKEANLHQKSPDQRKFMNAENLPRWRVTARLCERHKARIAARCGGVDGGRNFLK